MDALPGILEKQYVLLKWEYYSKHLTRRLVGFILLLLDRVAVTEWQRNIRIRKTLLI